jgi:hypothetical protein
MVRPLACRVVSKHWLSRVDKDAKEARNWKTFDLWLACYMQEECRRRLHGEVLQIRQRVLGPENADKLIST